jgi:hypothetical protein
MDFFFFFTKLKTLNIEWNIFLIKSWCVQDETDHWFNFEVVSEY